MLHIRWFRPSWLVGFGLVRLRLGTAARVLVRGIAKRWSVCEGTGVRWGNISIRELWYHCCVRMCDAKIGDTPLPSHVVYST
jgi:hypothetical protein